LAIGSSAFYNKWLATNTRISENTLFQNCRETIGREGKRGKGKVIRSAFGSPTPRTTQEKKLLAALCEGDASLQQPAVEFVIVL